MFAASFRTVDDLNAAMHFGKQHFVASIVFREYDSSSVVAVALKLDLGFCVCVQMGA